jgi:hypothetical protein
MAVAQSVVLVCAAAAAAAVVVVGAVMMSYYCLQSHCTVAHRFHWQLSARSAAAHSNNSVQR